MILKPRENGNHTIMPFTSLNRGQTQVIPVYWNFLGPCLSQHWTLLDPFLFIGSFSVYIIRYTFKFSIHSLSLDILLNLDCAINARDSTAQNPCFSFLMSEKPVNWSRLLKHAQSRERVSVVTSTLLRTRQEATPEDTQFLLKPLLFVTSRGRSPRCCGLSCSHS